MGESGWGMVITSLFTLLSVHPDDVISGVGGACPISICLHIIIILLHMALFVVWWYQFEEQVIVPLNLSRITSSTTVAASQGVALVSSKLIYWTWWKWSMDCCRYTQLCYYLLPNAWPWKAYSINIKQRSLSGLKSWSNKPFPSWAGSNKNIAEKICRHRDR